MLGNSSDSFPLRTSIRRDNHPEPEELNVRNCEINFENRFANERNP
jgi:hypothetical protein